MFIPLKDLNPSRSYPFVNITLILANIGVFIYQLGIEATHSQSAAAAFFLPYTTVPARIPSFLAGYTGFEAAFLPLVTSMFLHQNFLHIGGNMLFLWIFGDNVEDFFGHFTYLLFYLVCGIGAGLLHVLFNLHSTVPAIGASGAISGVMGAYILLYPSARILTLVFIFPLPVPAVVFLGLWFVLQFLSGLSMIGVRVTGGVAVWAHVGGFLLGMLLTAMARKR
jgi:membrane associated rhomboid family serine protease